MNMQGQGQGQYPPNLNGNNNGWNFQHQQHQQAQNAQRLQRHSFDGNAIISQVSLTFSKLLGNTPHLSHLNIPNIRIIIQVHPLEEPTTQGATSETHTVRNRIISNRTKRRVSTTVRLAPHFTESLSNTGHTQTSRTNTTLRGGSKTQRTATAEKEKFKTSASSYSAVRTEGLTPTAASITTISMTCRLVLTIALI